MGKNFKKEYIIAALSGVLFALPFLSKHLSPLAWICLVPFFVLLENSDSKKAFKLGLIFGTVANYIGFYWLVGTLTRFGGFPIAVSILFIFILCLYCSLQFAIFAFICSKLKLLKKHSLASIAIISALWVFIEFFFPQLFPFGIGNTQGFNTKIIQISDLFGVHLLSFIVIFANLAIFKLHKKAFLNGPAPIKEVVTTILLIAFLFLYGIWKIGIETKNISEANKIRVGIVQPNFDFFEKTEDNEQFVTEEHKRMSKEIGSADLIIWPETAIQKFLPTKALMFQFDERKVVPEIPNTYFLIGGLSYNVIKNSSETEIIQHNSAFLTDWTGQIIGKYHKIKLLLFGEYLPFSSIFPSIKNLSPATGNFTPGTDLNILEVREKGIRIAPLICYEDIIPYFSRKFVANGANLLINLTNDAWFGKTLAPYQHLLVSIPRAVETRRYLIRSTNTGVSAIIDPVGNVIAETKIFERVTLEEEVALLNSEKTVYTKVGDIFPWLCLIFFLIYMFNNHLRRKYS